MQKYEKYKEKNEWIVLGLMSGTSVDGLDICAVKFTYNKNDYDFKILKAKSIDYPVKLRKELINAISFTGEELVKLDQRFGLFIGNSVNKFLHNEPFKPTLIASHGHTVFHQPENGITCQIGDGQSIFDCTGIITINDFRKIDVVKGGQGAPLVPVGDDLLFNIYDACLNIGGFSNVSFKNADGSRIAYDIGAVNIVMNNLVRDVGLEYDDGGKMASSGRIIDELLIILNNIPYYLIPPPKSLGLEWVMKNIFPLFKKENYRINDLLRTYVEHVAIQINKAILKNLDYLSVKKVLITGGGAKNNFLIKRIKELNKDLIYVIPDNELVDFKEALIFGFLGLLKYTGKVNIYSSVTGARSNSSAGIIHN